MDFYVTAIVFENDKAKERINVYCALERVAHTVAESLAKDPDKFRQVEVMRFSGEIIKRYN